METELKKLEERIAALERVFRAFSQPAIGLFGMETGDGKVIMKRLPMAGDDWNSPAPFQWTRIEDAPDEWKDGRVLVGWYSNKQGEGFWFKTYWNVLRREWWPCGTISALYHLTYIAFISPPPAKEGA